MSNGNDQNIVKQFARFCSVGALNTVASLIVILTLSEIFDIWYLLANITGYIFGIVLGFILHRAFTFKTCTNYEKTNLQIIKFLIVFFVSYIFQLCVLIFLVSHLNVNEMVAQILAVAAYSIINFLGNRSFTFASSAKG